MTNVLLFNLSEGKRQRVERILALLGLCSRVVKQAEFGEPIGRLAGVPGAEKFKPGFPEAFSDEMLVLYNIPEERFQLLLRGLRENDAAVSLKAMITPNNAGWTAGKLHREIAAEHKAMAEKLKQNKK